MDDNLSFSEAPRSVFRVGAWHVDPGAHALSRDGTETRVEPKVMALLVALAARPGQTVSRDELMAEVWPDVIVSEDSLSRAISKLRTALEDDAQEPRYVETIPKAGYRLLAPVEHDAKVGQSEAASVPERSRWAFGAAVLAVLAVVVAVVVGIRAKTDREPVLSLRAVTHQPGIERHPALAPDGQRLAYVVASGRAGQDTDLYVQDVDGAEPLRLTDSPEDEWRPTWLPDGRVAFLRCEDGTCGVFAVSGSGGGARRLIDASVGPWGLSASPDGSLLVAVARRTPGAPYQLVLLDLARGTSRPFTLPSKGSVGDLSPAVAPDGERVAFVRHGPGGEEDVVVQRMTAGAEPLTLTQDGVPVAGLAWTEDGEAVVYAATHDGVEALWKVEVKGGDPERIVVDALGTPRNPSVRGRRLVYEAHTSEVNLYAADSTAGWQPVVVSTGIDEQPALHPAGDRLVFISDRSGSLELWSSDLDGSSLVRMTEFGGERLGAPRWSPDGRTIVFEVQVGGAGKLYRVATDGGTPQPLTDGGYDIGPRWSPDGQSIYFGSNRGSAPGIWRIAADGGVPEPVMEGFVGEPSADGHSLLVQHADTPGLWRHASDGDAVQIDSTLDKRDWGNWVVTTDGVLFVERSHGEARLVRLDPATGRRSIVRDDLGAVPSRVQALAVTPDGRRVVVARIDRIESAIVLAEPLGR